MVINCLAIIDVPEKVKFVIGMLINISLAIIVIAYPAEQQLAVGELFKKLGQDFGS